MNLQSNMTERFATLLRRDAAILPGPSMAGFVLKHGRLWDWKGENPKGFRRRRRPHGCFLNSANTVLDVAHQERLVLHPGQSRPAPREMGQVVYVEGFLLAAGCDYLWPHAWCAIGDRVIDQTLAPDVPRHGYFGVPFDSVFMAKHFSCNPGFGGLIHDVGCHYPLLFGTLSVDDFIFEGEKGESDSTQKSHLPRVK